MCRYGLVRRILQQQGIVPFAFATMILLAIGAPLTGSAVLLLPINNPEWTLLPSENHNPFDPINYRFMVGFTAVLVPLILVIERLLSEQADAGKRHEHVRAELHQLQQQINPHFLFNTLNTLYSLCLRDRTESAEAVIKLSDLLRYVVYHGQAQRTSLVDEIAYLRNYLDLQMLRYGHRCQLDCVWPDDPVDVALPPLLLIMLVENAFKHGVEPVDRPCHIHIDMTVEGQRLHFECVNALPATPVSGPAGLGLANLRRRLALIYGTNFQLDTGPTADGWRSRLALDLEPC
jgi:LytS/YehU family sensor histidine kinase